MSVALLRALAVAYGAALAVPVPWLAGQWGVLPAAVAGAAGGLVALGATLRIDPDRTLRSGRWLAALAVPPLGFLAVLVDHLGSVGDAGLIAPPTVGVLAIVPAGIAAIAAMDRAHRERVAEAEPIVTVEARPAPGQRRAFLAIGVVLIVAAVGWVAVSALVFGEPSVDASLIPVVAMAGVAIPLYIRTRQTVSVTPEGLVVERQRHDWDTVAGYRLTADAVVFPRTEWWRVDLHLDRRDVEAAPGFTEALDRFLPRLDGDEST